MLSVGETNSPPDYLETPAPAKRPNSSRLLQRSGLLNSALLYVYQRLRQHPRSISLRSTPEITRER